MANNTTPDEDTPVPTEAMLGLWSYLIESILPKFLQTATPVNASISEAALGGIFVIVSA